MSSPAPGTTRYLCPLECGWHHDVPPPSLNRVNELGAVADPHACDPYEAVNSIARDAYRREAEQKETALREHLATHTTEQFVRVIRDLRVEVEQLRDAGPARPGEERVILSPGRVELPEGAEGRYSDDFLERLNQPRRKPTA